MQIIFRNTKQQISPQSLIVKAQERTSIQEGYLEFIINYQANYRMVNVEQFSKIQPDHRLFVKFNDQSQKFYQAMLIQKDDLDPYVIQILNCPKSPSPGDIVTSIQRKGICLIDIFLLTFTTSTIRVETLFIIMNIIIRRLYKFGGSHHSEVKQIVQPTRPQRFQVSDPAPFAYHDVREFPKDYKPWAFNYKQDGIFVLFFLTSWFAYYGYEKNYLAITEQTERKKDKIYYKP